MTEHISQTAIESYLLGTAIDLDVDAIDRHVATCEACARRVREELELELRLGEVGRNATFCPGCSRLVGGERCDECGAAMVAGSYHIESVLVRTTHGRLYVARDENGHRVALKELAFVQTPSFEALAAFERETKFLRALQHPGIPRFHASFVHGTGIHTRLYLAQDLVEGESLLARLSTHWFEEREIVDIAGRVLEILVYLQNLSPMIFHRDVKPANLIQLPDGSISLVDFGAARDVSETMGNTSIGTFGYMPVEQMGGIVDGTTDTYALGASLLHLLTRREPWKLLEAGPVGVNVSPPLRKYLHKLVARRPQDRFPTARAALDALRALDLKPARSRKRFVPLVMVGLVAAGVAGAAIAMRAQVDPSLTVEPPAVPREVNSNNVPPSVSRQRVVGPEIESPVTRDPLKSPFKKSGCSIEDRLPSGGCATDLISPTTLPALQPVLAKIDTPRVAADLREQIDRAIKAVNKAGGGGVVVGRVVVDGPEDPRSVTTYQQPVGEGYYAVAATGSIEFLLHGYQRARVEPKIADSVQWVGETRLVPVPERDKASLKGRVAAAANVRLSAYIGYDGPIHTVTRGTSGLRGPVFPAPVQITVGADGRFSASGFTPGKYTLILTLASGAQVRREVTFTASMQLDVGTLDAGKPDDHVDVGYLTVSSKPRAAIFVDGVDTGKTTPTKLVLAAGKHKIQFVYGQSKSTFPITIKAGETLTLHKDLQ